MHGIRYTVPRPHSYAHFLWAEISSYRFASCIRTFFLLQFSVYVLWAMIKREKFRETGGAGERGTCEIKIERKRSANKMRAQKRIYMKDSFAIYNLGNVRMTCMWGICKQSARLPNDEYLCNGSGHTGGTRSTNNAKNDDTTRFRGKCTYVF